MSRASGPRPPTITRTRPPGPGGAAPVVERSADVALSAAIGAHTRVWHLAQVREHARVGERCTIGRGAYVGPGVRIGDGCKVQNHALVYEPAVLEDGVFVGPAVVLTNDLRPRAVMPDLRPQTDADWEAVGVRLRQGASVGARAVCVAPVTIGRWAMVAAGAVVTRDVPDFALVAGVPARQVGWVGRSGSRLVEVAPGRYRCPVTGAEHALADGLLRELGQGGDRR